MKKDTVDINSLKELYLQGKIEAFLEAIKDIEDNSPKVKVLKLLAKALKAKSDNKDELLQEAKELESEILSLSSRATVQEQNEREISHNDEKISQNNWKESISEELSYIGLIYLLLADLDKAKEVLERAIETPPISPYAYFRLGTLYAITDDFEKAKELILKGLEIEEVAEAYHNLGFIYKNLEDMEKAKEAYLKGWELKPYRLSIATKLFENLTDEEIEALKEELEGKIQKINKRKELANILARLALIENRLGDTKSAIIKLSRAVALDEENEELRTLYIHFMLKEERYWILGSKLIDWTKKYDKVKEHLALAECRIESSFLEKAKEGLEAIRDRVESEKLEYEMLWAKYYKENNEHDKAKEILEKLFEEYPNYMPVVMALSDLYNSLGEVDKSLEILENIGKDAIGVLIRRVDAKKEVSKDDLEKLKEHLEKVDDDDFKATINFSLANGYDKLKEYKEAAKYLKDANDLIYKKLDYSIEEFRKEIDDIVNGYSKEWLEAKQNLKKFDKRPIFIVGMPRSGTTMLEQIFAAHGSVFGAGELPYIGKIINLSQKITKRAYPDSFLKAPKELIEDAGRYYIELTKRMYQFDEPIFVDKLPHNFMHSALLLAMFPDSKVIALRRDYRAIALSNYFQNFAAKRGTLGYAFDLEAMGEHIKDYLRTMEFYKKILPSDRYREFWYEDLVANPKEKIPEVLEFCDLDFTPEVLEFYKNKTAVKTASILQVRNPIYTKSAQKWKHYEELLKPTIDIVGDKGTYNFKE